MVWVLVLLFTTLPPRVIELPEMVKAPAPALKFRPLKIVAAGKRSFTEFN